MTNPPCQQSTPGIYTFALQVKDDDGGENIATGTLTVIVSPIRLTNAGWESVSQYCPVNEDIYVEIYDLSRDLNILAPDALIATVVNSTTTDTETMTLAETGNSTAIFRGTLNLVASATHANGHAMLEAQGGDAIQLQYTDPANSQDTSTQNGTIIPGSCEIHLTVTKSGGAAHLSWTGISGSYQVRRSIDSSFGTYEAFVPIGGPAGTTYDDPDSPLPGDIFYYLVENQ